MACGVIANLFFWRECFGRNRKKSVALHCGHPRKQLLSIRPALTGTANCFNECRSGQRLGLGAHPLPGRLSNRRTWIKLRIGIAQSDAAKEGTTMRSRERERGEV